MHTSFYINETAGIIPSEELHSDNGQYNILTFSQ